MAKVLEMPKLSPTMTEGQLTVWHKKEGDAVAVDDLLAEVETDKATMEFRSFDKGTLLKLLVPADSLVQLGQPVAIIGEQGEDISKLVPAQGAAPAAQGGSAKNGEAVPAASGAPTRPNPAPEASARVADAALSGPAGANTSATVNRAAPPTTTAP